VRKSISFSKEVEDRLIEYRKSRKSEVGKMMPRAKAITELLRVALTNLEPPKPIEERIDDAGRDFVTSDCLSAAELPDIFVCFNYGSLHPRCYIRLGKDNWDVHLWMDHWQFFDNIGDQLAVESFNESWHKFRIIWPEEYGE
jgi:hypothetical protein